MIVFFDRIFESFRIFSNLGFVELKPFEHWICRTQTFQTQQGSIEPSNPDSDLVHP